MGRMGKGSFDPSKTIGGEVGLCETAQNNHRRFSDNFVGRLKHEGRQLAAGSSLNYALWLILR
jgi:hypothetical protein